MEVLNIRLFTERLAKEELSKLNPVTDNPKTVLVIGRFQPLHKGHLNFFKNVYKKFNCKVSVVQIHSNNKNSPLSESTLKQVNELIRSQHYDFLNSINIFPLEDYKFSSLDNIVRFIRTKGYEPIGLGCGEDRIKQWSTNLKWVKEKSDLQLVDDFKIENCDDRSAGFSGTKVRETLINDDYSQFKEYMPEYLWKFFKPMREEILKAQEEKQEKK